MTCNNNQELAAIDLQFVDSYSEELNQRNLGKRFGDHSNNAQFQCNVCLSPEGVTLRMP